MSKCVAHVVIPAKAVTQIVIPAKAGIQKVYALDSGLRRNDGHKQDGDWKDGQRKDGQRKDGQRKDGQGNRYPAGRTLCKCHTHAVIPAPLVIPAKAGIQSVIPAKAGIQNVYALDSGLRRNDGQRFSGQKKCRTGEHCMPWILVNKVSQPVGAGDTPSGVTHDAGVLL